MHCWAVVQVHFPALLPCRQFTGKWQRKWLCHWGTISLRQLYSCYPLNTFPLPKSKELHKEKKNTVIKSRSTAQVKQGWLRELLEIFSEIPIFISSFFPKESFSPLSLLYTYYLHFCSTHIMQLVCLAKRAGNSSVTFSARYCQSAAFTQHCYLSTRSSLKRQTSSGS